MTAPHARPFHFVDRRLGSDGRTCSVVRVVSADEPLQEERRDAGRALPASLIFETLAQAAAGLAEAPAADRPAPDVLPAPAPAMIVAIHAARLHAPVLAGDRLRVTASLVGRLGGMIRVRSVATRDGASGAPIAEGEFTIATGEAAAAGGRREERP